MPEPRLLPRRDVATAVAFIALGALEVHFARALNDIGPGAVVPDMAAVVLIAAPLAVRRRHPLAAALVCASSGWINVVLGGTSDLPMTSMVPFVVVAYGAGRRLDQRDAVIAVIAMVVAMESAVIAFGDADPVAIFISVGPWFAGRTTRARETLGRRLAQIAAELEHEREAYVELSVLRERRRVARDLHDIVAHAMSTIVVQATAGRLVAATDAEVAAGALDAIERAALEAADDAAQLHDLLGERRSRGLADLPACMAHAAGSGLRTTLHGDLSLDLEPEADAAAYRVVQEALTNAGKHAPGADVRITVIRTPTAVRVAISNGPARRPVGELHFSGAGEGLRGMAERARALDGTLYAGPHGDGWRVALELPIAAPAVPSTVTTRSPRRAAPVAR